MRVQTSQLLFGPFRLDPSERRLWRGKREVALQPRPWAVLHYLVEHPGQVVSKEELLKEVWAGTYVTTTALKVSVRAIRVALGEDTGTPRYIETVGRVGYRFIAPLSTAQLVQSPKSKVNSPYSPLRTPQSWGGRQK